MMLRIAPWFRNVDPRVVAGVASMGIATGSWVAAAYALVQLVSDPAYLVALYWAIMHVRAHRAGDADIYAIAQIVAALLALLGTAIIAMALALYGTWPSRRHSDVPDEVGATSPSTNTKG
jgi:hypothetical protein